MSRRLMTVEMAPGLARGYRVAPVVSGGGGGTDFSNILWSDGFESGTLGNSISGSYGDSHATYSNSVTPASGSQCLADIATSGATENANGFTKTIGHDALEGDELWGRCKVYFPTGSDITYSGSGLKWMRWNSLTSGGSNQGYIDIYMSVSIAACNWRYQREAIDDRNFTLNTPLSFDAWHTIEWYTKLHHTAGSGNVRLWVDGDFVEEATDIPTLVGATDKVTTLYQRTYWNGGAPSTQTWYWDDFAIAVKIAGWRDDTPYLSTDSGGRKFIGTGSP